MSFNNADFPFTFHFVFVQDMENSTAQVEGSVQTNFDKLLTGNVQGAEVQVTTLKPSSDSGQDPTYFV